MTAVHAACTNMHHQVVYQSPKRKRGPELDSVTSRLITSGFRRASDASESIESHSPCARVTGKFQRLRLQSPIETAQTVPSGGVGDGVGTSTPDQDKRDKAQVQNTTTTTTSSSSSPASLVVITPPQASAFTFESRLDFSASSPKRTDSSPPSDVMSDQFWQADEITGWSPNDPDEDNYGVNGVGYRKTPALAHSLSQKRKQQIAEYRSRETKDARQKRGERRLNKRLSGSPQPVDRSSEDVKSPSKKTARLVRFEDG